MRQSGGLSLAGEGPGYTLIISSPISSVYKNCRSLNEKERFFAFWGIEFKTKRGYNKGAKQIQYTLCVTVGIGVVYPFRQNRFA